MRGFETQSQRFRRIVTSERIATDCPAVGRFEILPVFVRYNPDRTVDVGVPAPHGHLALVVKPVTGFSLLVKSEGSIGKIADEKSL